MVPHARCYFGGVPWTFLFLWLTHMFAERLWCFLCHVQHCYLACGGGWATPRLGWKLGNLEFLQFFSFVACLNIHLFDLWKAVWCVWEPLGITEGFSSQTNGQFWPIRKVGKPDSIQRCLPQPSIIVKLNSKKPWLFRVHREKKTTQLCGDY